MSAAEAAEGLHPQDRLLIVEALAYWASGHGSLSQPVDTTDRRKHRAAQLARCLFDAENVEGSFEEAIDAEWDGSERGDTERDSSERGSKEARALAAGRSNAGESEEADA